MLDTNMCIYLMKNQPAQVAERFAQCYVGEVVMSAITFAELSYGVSVSADPRREAKNLSSLVEDIPVAPFDELAGTMYGPIRRATRESKKDHLDKLIAAHSKALSVTLVTNNLKDFEKYPSVTAENWLV
jgi:tRNA(fMet)-specific endonuclease VapC